MNRADADDQAAPWWALLPWLGIVVGAIAWVYAPVLRAGFVWDDDDHFVENHAVADPHGLAEIWGTGTAIYYPLTLTVWWVIRQVAGLDPLPYHLANLACHATTAVLGALLLVRWRWPVPIAAMAALLWAIHPVQVESAAWATELKNTLSGALLMGCVHAWLTYLRDDERGLASYLVAIVLLAGALLAKPSTVPAPMLLLLIAVWEKGRLDRDIAATLALPFAMALAWAGWTIWEQRFNSNARGYEWELSLAQRLLLAANTPVFYLQKTLVPYPISFIYPRWDLHAPDAAMFVRPLVLLGLGGALARALLADGNTRGVPRAALLATLAWLALLFPVCGLFVIYFQRFSYVADHFQYLASMVPCAAVVYVLRRWLAPTPLIAVAMVIAVAAGVWSNALATHYRDAETLWRRTLATNPEAWIASNNLGFLLLRRGAVDDAMPHLDRAIALKADYDEALNNKGVAMAARGEYAEAESLFRRAIEARPDYADAMSNLAMARAAQGAINDAVEWQERATVLWHGDPTMHADLGALLLRAGRTDDALAAYRRAARLAPGSALYAERVEALRRLSSR